MRQDRLRQSLIRRLASAPNQALVLLLGGMFCTLRWAGPGGTPTPAELSLPFLVFALHLSVAPLPWQWSGDEAPRAGFGRGLLQAVLFNGAWSLLLAQGIHFLGPGLPQRPPPRPELAAHPGPPPGSPPRPGLPGGGLTLANFAFALVFGWLIAEKEATEDRERRTGELLRSARSRALQNQLDPHVLYNALNGLSELIHEDPLAAEEAVSRLADLYRRLTRHGSAEAVTLGEERALVEAYLAMEEMRLGERLRVEWDWEPALEHLRVPPLLLQPLVENAIKHGISPHETGGQLRLRGALEGARCVLEVANTGCPLAPEPGQGLGLGNLEARLALWNPGRATLTLDEEGGWTRAVLSWPWKEA